MTIYKELSCPRDCYDTCRLVFSIENNIIKNIKPSTSFPTNGVTCPKGITDHKHAYSSKRILYPFININKSGTFRRIEWDEALDTIVGMLKELLPSRHSILFMDHSGNRGLITKHASRRLWNYLGVARIDDTICDANGEKALRLLYGSTYGIFPKDIDNLRMAIVWGFNPFASAVHIFHTLLGIRRKGGFITTIDVRYSETAEHSDLFISPRPGTDGVLALGIARYLIENDMIDHSFIDKYVHGFREFSNYVSRYTLDYVERVTSVPKDIIIRLAEEMYHRRPNIGIFIGYGVQRRVGGGDIVRAIASIPPLLGIHRGFFYGNRDGLPIDFDYIEGRYLGTPSRVISNQKIGRYLHEGEFNFIYIHLSNPVATLPNASKVLEGLKRKDVFVVVHDTHWSDTAKIADIVLPAPTYLEKLDVVYSYWHNIICINHPVIESLGESFGEYQVMCEISRRLGIENDVCLPIDILLERTLGSKIYKELINNKCVELEPWRKDEYRTPTGKIELYSTLAEKEGLSPLPIVPEGEVLGGNEFLLISSATREYLHTQFEDVYGEIKPIVYINSDDAKMLNINDNDRIELYNSYGSATLLAKISSRVPRKVLWIVRGAKTLDGSRINVLVRDDVDYLGKGSVINSTIVKIRKI